MEIRQDSNNLSDDQISIWSVRRRLFISYFIVFSLLFLLVSVVAGWLSYNPVINIRDTAELGMTAMGLASGRILWLAAFSIITVEVGNVIVEYLIVDRYKRGKKEANKKWQDWYERMQAAKREGRPFDEPPPGDGEHKQ